MKLRNLYNVGDHVLIINTHSTDFGKEGIIIERHCSYCKIQLLKSDGTYEVNPQNNKPIIINHTYVQFKKI